jgi:hypothetical protein
MPTNTSALLSKRNEFLDKLSWKLIPILIIGQIFVMVPGVLHPRTTVPAAMAWTFGVLFWVFHSMESQRRYKWGSLVLLLVGSGIVLGGLSQGWTSTLIGDASRRAGGLDWLAWTLLALTIPVIVKTEDRWRWVLVYLAVLGELQAIAAMAEPYLLTVTEGSILDSSRRYGLTANPGFLGLYTMVGAIAAMFLVRSERIFGFVLILCLWGLWLSGTRAGFLGVMVAIPFLPYRPRVMVGVFLTMLVPTAIMFADRGLDPVRSYLWIETLKETLMRPWGHGFMSFTQENLCVAGFDNLGIILCDFPHNMFLQIGYETGILGWLAVGVFAFYAVKRLRGPWAALGAAFAMYSVFWIPSPGWFLMFALLIARVAWSGSAAEAVGTASQAERPVGDKDFRSTNSTGKAQYRRRRKGFRRS